MYSAISDQADQLAIRFCAEAERLWQIEQENGTDSVLNLAAAEFLSLGYLGQGRDHSVLRYLKEAANMGSRMSLFAVGDQDDATSCKTNLDAETRRARMYAAWGTFNWLTFVSLQHPIMIHKQELTRSGLCRSSITNRE